MRLFIFIGVLKYCFYWFDARLTSSNACKIMFYWQYTPLQAAADGVSGIWVFPYF